MADPDIRLEGGNLMFPSSLFLRWMEATAKLEGRQWPNFHPLDPPLLLNIYITFVVKYLKADRD